MPFLRPVFKFFLNDRINPVLWKIISLVHVAQKSALDLQLVMKYRLTQAPQSGFWIRGGGGVVKIRHEVPVHGTKCRYRGHEVAEKNSWGVWAVKPRAGGYFTHSDILKWLFQISHWCTAVISLTKNSL